MKSEVHTSPTAYLKQGIQQNGHMRSFLTCKVLFTELKSRSACFPTLGGCSARYDEYI